MTTAPVGCLDGEQAIRDALAALPDGWGCAFVESREKEFGIVEIGHPWEDDQGLAEVITVDTENYYDSPAASKIAAFIVAANPKSIAALLAELDRLRSASRQEGWQLVPVEPTPEMLLAGLQCAQQSESDLFITELMDIYTAMRRASPQGGSVTGWISVEERLPPTTHHVLACNALGYVGRAAWDGKRWNHIGKPTHWMPLPAAPHQSQEAQGDRHGE